MRRVDYSYRFVSILLLATSTAIAGCGSDPMTPVEPMPDPDPDPMPVDKPSITTAELIQHPDNVLIATLEIETDLPTKLAVEVVGEDVDPWLVPLGEATAIEHTVPIVGMRAETAYQFVVTATAENGEMVVDESLSMTTESLPEGFPPIEATVIAPEKVAPGFTVVSPGKLAADTPPGSTVDGGIMFAVDNEGEVVWYYRADHGLADDQRQLNNGNFLVINEHKELREIDMMGNVVDTIIAEDIGIDSFHHEILELPSGDYLTLSTELRLISGYQDADGNDVEYNVVGDVIVEFSPTGEIINEVNLFDLLNPLRITPSFETPFWDRHYNLTGTKDWTHGNAVIIDPTDDNYIVSLRHQDWLLKIDRATGEIIWTLGVDGDFTLAEGASFAYHHHAPEFQPEGTLMLYDNGNGRPLPAGEPPFTRVVQFELNEADMEIDQVWEYRGEAPYFTPAVGDADRLSNGNILIVNGSLTSNPQLPLGVGLYSRITEVTFEEQPQKVFEFLIQDDSPETEFGFLTYRAERIESLYPPVE